MNNFLQRTLSGAVFVAVIIGSTLLSKYTFLALMMIINMLCITEYSRLFKGKDYGPATIPTMVYSTLLFLIMASSVAGIGLFPEWVPLAGGILLWLPFLTELFNERSLPFHRAIMAVGGMMYITVPLLMFTALPFVINATGTDVRSDDFMLPVCYFILIWSSDTFAYLCGKAFGRHKLFPRVSPGKTWEGSIGGFFCTLGIAFLLSETGLGWIQLERGLVMAGTIVIFGTLGDLVESSLKRSLNIKDSGNLMPGHGGALDRFDSLLFSAPFVFLSQVPF